MIATCEPGLNRHLVAGVDVGGTESMIVVIDDGPARPQRSLARLGLPEREGVGER